MVLASGGALRGPATMTEYRLTGGMPERMTPQREQAMEALEGEQATIRELSGHRRRVAKACCAGWSTRACSNRWRSIATAPTPAPSADFAAPELTDEPARGGRDGSSRRSKAAELRALPARRGDRIGQDRNLFRGRSPRRWRQDRQVLVLLPEIALTEAFLRRFEDRFGAAPGACGTPRSNRPSGAAPGGPSPAGEAQVVVGARSALFLPYANLGLIVVDEAHEISFKQDDGVRYNARDVAVMRARFERIPVILASATPGARKPAHGRQRHLREARTARAASAGRSCPRSQIDRPDRGEARARPLARPAAGRGDEGPAGARRAVAAVPQPPRLCPADAVPQLRLPLPVPQLQRLAGRTPPVAAPRLPPLRARNRAARRLPRMRRARLPRRLRPGRRADRRRGGRAVARGARRGGHFRHAQFAREAPRNSSPWRKAGRST